MTKVNESATHAQVTWNLCNEIALMVVIRQAQQVMSEANALILIFSVGLALAGLFVLR